MTAVDTRIAKIRTSAIIITPRLEQHLYPFTSESQDDLRVSQSSFGEENFTPPFSEPLGDFEEIALVSSRKRKNR